MLYISPLKALNNDIERNLRQPLQGVVQTAEAVGHQLRELRAGVRTGDTPTRQRQEQIRRPPDILITTPESLHLLLTSRGREILTTVETVIVDEIHAVCGTKRGVFLSLLLERLEEVSCLHFKGLDFPRHKDRLRKSRYSWAGAKSGMTVFGTLAQSPF